MMWQVYLGILLFGGVHLWSLFAPAQRDQLKARLGESRFKLAYSALSLAGVVFLALGYMHGRAGPGAPGLLYQPLDNARHLAMAVILLGFILIFSNGSKAHIRLWLKHPFSIGIMLWSAAHLLVNGETAVVLIFATFFLIALLDVVLSLARGSRPVFEPTWSHDLRAVIVGIVLYLIFMLGFHPYVLNIPVA
jgi:uncharacterized membrane protein